MPPYPVQYLAPYEEERSRLTVFFRLLLAIPHFFVAWAYSIAAAFSVSLAWFVVVITGRYPEGLYHFNAGLLQYYARFNAYVYLQVDQFPPFVPGDDPGHPVRLLIGPPQERYSRPKAAFRLILAIPLLIVSYAYSIIGQLAAVGMWFVAVVVGRAPRMLYDGLDLHLAFQSRVYAYLALLTETWPPFTNEDGQAAMPPGADPLGGWLRPAPSRAHAGLGSGSGAVPPPGR